jgi:membrane protease YdiL (CAAX protease family)
LSGVVKFILFLYVLFLISKQEYLKLRSVLKNIIFFVCLSAVLIFFSIEHSFNVIESSKINISNIRLYSYFFQCLSTGFFEEFFFRILIFGIISSYFYQPIKKNVYKEAVLTSLIFSLCHLSNLLNSSYDFIGVLNQVIFAFLIGMIFQSILQKFNNIIIVSVLHGLTNFLGTIKSKLLLLAKYTEGGNSYEDFLNSLVMAFIISIIIVLPMSFYCLKCKENKLLQNNILDKIFKNEN